MVGEDFGAFIALTWACEYPDDMEFIFVVNSSFKLGGYKYILEKSVENIIDSIDDYYSEGYSASKTKSIVAITTLVFAHSSSKVAFNKLHNSEIDAILEDFIDDALFLDVYDIKYLNDANLKYDLEDKLSKIKAKSLFVSTNDYYFDFEMDMLPFKELVKDSIVLKQDSVKEDYYYKEEDYAPIGKEVLSFLEQFKK